MAQMSIEEAKQQVSRRFIGNSGIHGVGIRRSKGAICLYSDRSPSKGSLAEIKELIAPYDLIVVQEERPTFAARLRSWVRTLAK